MVHQHTSPHLLLFQSQTENRPPSFTPHFVLQIVVGKVSAKDPTTKLVPPQKGLWEKYNEIQDVNLLLQATLVGIVSSRVHIFSTYIFN